MPIIVNAGSHKVQENVAKTNIGNTVVGWAFAFVSSTATGPTGDNRATSGTASNGGNPITINVPYFDDPTNGGETLVTFTNRVLRAQVKVCKVVDPGSLTPLGNNVWSYHAVALGLGSATPDQTASNGTCTGLIAPGDGSSAGWQVVTTSGAPVAVTVTESLVSGSPAWFISGASVDNGAATTINGHNITFVLVPGINVLTVTNKFAID